MLIHDFNTSSVHLGSDLGMGQILLENPKTFLLLSPPKFTFIKSEVLGMFSPRYLVVVVGVSKKMFEEVQTGTLPDQDQVCGAVGEVGGGRQAFRTPRTRAAHTGRVDGNELAVDDTPASVAV